MNACKHTKEIKEKKTNSCLTVLKINGCAWRSLKECTYVNDKRHYKTKDLNALASKEPAAYLHMHTRG